jgi:Ca2+-dependent lipid-binding protein
MQCIDGFLEIYIRNGKHMPKLNAFGLCDPFLSVAFAGRQTRTAVKKRTYSPEWNEKLVFSAPAHPSSLIIDLFHMSWSSRFERIGTHVIAWEQLLAAISQTVEPRLHTFTFFNGGKEVIGSDGSPTEVFLCVIMFSE